ncbi:TPA: hypothetical protein ACJIOU_005023 [Escherichia coli]
MLKDYQSIYDFVINHTERTPEGLIKIVEGGKERLLGGDKLEDYCSRLREMVERKQVRLFIRNDGIYVKGR